MTPRPLAFFVTAVACGHDRIAGRFQDAPLQLADAGESRS